jgi:hypothetical protein
MSKHVDPGKTVEGMNVLVICFEYLHKLICSD